MTDSTIVKIVAQHTRDYNDLDTRYKKLGVKHLTLLEVHKKTLTELSDLESRHHDLLEEMKAHVERFVDLKIRCRNKKLLEGCKE